MKFRSVLAIVVLTLLAGLILFGQSSANRHFNPMVDLLAQKKVVVGVAYPSNPRAPGAFRGEGGGRGEGAARETATFNACNVPPAPPESRGQGAARGAAGGRGAEARGGAGRGGNAPATPPVMKSPAELAKLALDYHATDFLFGSMEGGVDAPLPAFTEFMKGMMQVGPVAKTPFAHLSHPVIVKTPNIAKRDPQKVVQDISRQLNTGISGLMFVGVECAKEVETGLADMRFASKGGKRPDNLGEGIAPTYWGMSEKEYKEKADVWPLNPNGELVNWTIVESKEGLKHVREIAAVKGIGVLWPGAGTLGGVFSSVNADGQRVRDDKAWEDAIQQVLAACKEFNVPCGYPAGIAPGPNNIEMRMKQGFSVFVMQSFDDNAFKAVELGRKLGGRPPTN